MWGKSRKSVEILNEKKVNYKIIEYIKKGLTKKELITISIKLNLPPSDFIRAGDRIFHELNLKNSLNNRTKIINAIIENPKLLERPIIIKDKKAIIARPAELLYDFL